MPSIDVLSTWDLVWVACFVTVTNYFWTAHPQLEECSRLPDARVVCYSDRKTIIGPRPIILRLPTSKFCSPSANPTRTSRGGTDRGNWISI